MSECHLHKRQQHKSSNDAKLERCASIIKDGPPQVQVQRGQWECCDPYTSGECEQAPRTGYPVNNIPAHMSQAHSVRPHQQQYLKYQTVPYSNNNRLMQDSSLIQSATQHLQSFYSSGFGSSQQPYRPPLEHLDMSASSDFSNTFNSRSNNSFISNNSMNCSTAAEDDSDQPINYSLKEQDISSSYRGSTSSSGNVQMSYDYIAPSVGGLNFRHMVPEKHMVSENLRSASVKGYSSWNNSAACDKLAAKIKGSDISVSSSIASTPVQGKPVSKLVHGHFHTSHGNQSVETPHQQHASQTPQFMTPQAPYTNASFHPRGHMFASSHSVQNPCASLQSNVALSHLEYSSRGKPFSTSADQFNTLQTSHQNTQNLVQQCDSTYPETDLDIVTDQLTNFSLQNHEEDRYQDDRREQLYSVHSDNSSERGQYNRCAYTDKRHCVDCKYMGIMLADDSSDQVFTYCTEGIPDLPVAATSLAGYTGMIERKEKTVGVSKQQTKGASGKGCIDSSAHMMAASLSGYQTTRQTEIVGVCKGQGLGPETVRCTSEPADDHTVRKNFYSSVDFNEAALDQTKTYCEEGTPISFSPASSHSSLRGANPGEAGVYVTQNCTTDMTSVSCIAGSCTPISLKSIIDKRSVCPMPQPALNFRHTDMEQVLKGDLDSQDNNQVEETPLMFSRSSSPESLNSCDTQSIHSSVASEYSWKTNEVLSPSEIPNSPSELMPPSQGQAHSSNWSIKDIPLYVKSAIIAEQSLNFKKIYSPVPAESLNTSPPDEKYIYFTRKISELQLYPEEDNNQQIDFPLSQKKQEDPNLMFSMLQEITPLANTNQNAPFVNGDLASHDEVMSINEDMETEFSSGKSEDLVEYAEEGTPGEFSETTSLSAITIDSSPVGDVSEYSDIQLHPHQSCLPADEETSSGSHSIDVQDASAVFSVALDSEHVKDGIEHEDRSAFVFDEYRNTAVSDDCRNTAGSDENSDLSVSDVSQEEENILAQCISSGMPTAASSARKIKSKRQSGISVKISSGAHMKHQTKMSSVLKSMPKKLAPLFKTPADSVRSDDNIVDTEDCLQVDVTKNDTGRQVAEFKADTGRKRSPSRDSNFSSSSCSSTSLPKTQFRKNLKQIGGKIESPESRVRLGAVFELSDECSLLEQAYFQSVPLQLRSAV